MLYSMKPPLHTATKQETPSEAKANRMGNHMKKLTVTQLVEWIGKEGQERQAFIDRIRSAPRSHRNHVGGNYWATGLDAVCRSFVQNDLRIIDQAISDLQQRIQLTGHPIVRDMYAGNIALLQNYQALEQNRLRPASSLEVLAPSAGKSRIEIDTIPLEVCPSHIYTFRQGGRACIGGIWFIARNGGYRPEEAGLYCDLLHRLLHHHYARRYQVLPEYCLAVELTQSSIIRYADLEQGSIPGKLDRALEELRSLL